MTIGRMLLPLVVAVGTGVTAAVWSTRPMREPPLSGTLPDIFVTAVVLVPLAAALLIVGLGYRTVLVDSRHWRPGRGA